LAQAVFVVSSAGLSKIEVRTFYIQSHGDV